jgi:AAA family ATP:ADP antiporter
LGTVDFGTINRSQMSRVTTSQPVHETHLDPVVMRIIDLRSKSVSLVRSALNREEALDPLLVAHVIPLLARDDLYRDATIALRRVALTAVGQLADTLLNVEADFAVRRRIPRILAGCASPLSVEVLLRSLSDSRFEVRFNCGRALSRILITHQQLAPSLDIMYSAVLEEIRLSRRLVEAPGMLDHWDDKTDSSFVDDLKWDSTDIRLEHIFRLLSVCLPREPLNVAFQALHTNDVYLKGTALEYLESILPANVRDELWPFLEGPSRPRRVARSSDEVLAELMRSRQLTEGKLDDNRVERR